MGHMFTQNSGCQGKGYKRLRKPRESLSGGRKVNTGSLEMSLEKKRSTAKGGGRRAKESPQDSLTYLAKPPNGRRTNATSLLVDNPTNLTREGESYRKDELRKAH